MIYYLTIGLIGAALTLPAYSRARADKFRWWLALMYVAYVTVGWLPIGVWLLINWRRST